MTEQSNQTIDVAEIPVVILCGGMGTRLREASGDKVPKPLVDIGGRPILWHLMKIYQSYGFRKFVLCLGYRGDQIKRYFLDYRESLSDFTLTHDGAEPVYHSAGPVEDWEITFVETGLETATAERVKRVAKHLNADHFMLTYGDGIGDVDLNQLVANHAAAGRIGTVTAVHPASRYGEMHVDGDVVTEFNEKPTLATGWVNGGFFMFQRSFVEKYLSDVDETVMLESTPLQQIARDGQLALNPHEGFWMGMDTYRDWTELNKLWDSGQAAWKSWED
ncbi:glucose-1-phosphate cytidylyltransferase [Spongisporangium articulatum]|uniref:Glucose-1-phosphate cytidylyltransferase n=1 Tax=Spongisporangium articulatum TaxID=3362603 RepID=A0ABW8ALE2_9ACTN